MTNSIFLGKTELNFTHPLSEELVLYAAPRIQQNLTQVMEHFYDEETRDNDPRRMHTPLERTIFRADYEKDTIKITNVLPEGEGVAPQFSYLYYGNLGAPICAKGKTQRILKGWSSNDRHRTRAQGGKRTIAGDWGVERPKMLKFWDKHEGMFVYRRCVRPIGQGIITSFQSSIRQAVFQAIESAQYDISDDADQDTGIPLGTSDGITENIPVGDYSPTMEEIIFSEEGSHHTEAETEAVEDQQLTTASREGQKVEEQERKWWMMASDIKNVVSTKVWKPLRRFFG